MPGFKPATDNVAAPVMALQQVYLQDYGLKKYYPTLVHLHHFSPHDQMPVYYSLEMPTTTVFSPRSSRLSSKMVDLRELKHILETFLSETLKGHLMIEQTPLARLAKTIDYNFYHSNSDQHNEILPAIHLASLDSTFNTVLADCPEMLFPSFSPFFNGCISISHKPEEAQ